MKLKDLMVDVKSAWFDYPECPGFQVEISHLSRQELTKIRDRCTINKIDRSTRMPKAELDSDRFVDILTKSTIKNWKGLKLKYIETLLPIGDIEETEKDTELEFSNENALDLVKGSSEFDTWVNEITFDLSSFRTRAAG